MKINEAINFYPEGSLKYNILKYIKENGSITTYDAFRDLNTTKFLARISEIRQDGVPIESKKETNKNTGKRYNRYYFKEGA